MVAFTVKAEMSQRLRSILAEIGPETRRALFSVGANALRLEVRRHVRREAGRRHSTARRLSEQSNFTAQTTGHLERGAARIVSHSTENGAEVIVPIAGISRAFHDLVIRPRKAKTLTIPISGVSYGHRAAELERMGWNLFRLPKTDILAGERDGEFRGLYALKKQVTVRKDRTLLPSDQTVSRTINSAVARRINDLLRAG